MTAVKKAMLSCLSSNDCLISAARLKNYLNQQGITPSRSTIWRELSFLLKTGLIRKVTVGRKIFYEMNTAAHQHLICLHCSAVFPIQLDLQMLQAQAEQCGFQLSKEQLQIFGCCKNCSRGIDPLK